MNKERRKALLDIMVQLEELKSSIEEIQEEDEGGDGRRENMPENLQGSERYERSEEASGNLSDAISSLEDSISSIGEAIEE